jgi:hypothetical protein
LIQGFIQQSSQRKNCIRGCGSESLDDARATPCPMVPPSQAVNAYGSLNTGPTVESGPLTGNRPRITERERMTTPAQIKSTR